MPRTYQVLRNNRQTGPYTLEELRTLPLQDHDLIWAEGQAGGWRTPAEVKELSAEAQTAAAGGETNPVHGEAVPDHDPANLIEERAARLHARMQSYLEEQKKEAEGGEPHTRYVRNLDQLRQDYADWLHAKHRKGHSSRIPMAVLVAIILFCSGFLASRWYYEREGAATDVSLTNDVLQGIQAEPAILTEEVTVPHAAFAPRPAAREVAGRAPLPEGSRSAGSVKKEGPSWRSARLRPKEAPVHKERETAPIPKKKTVATADTTRPTVTDLVNKYLGIRKAGE